MAELKFDKFVEELTKDLNEIPKIILLSGFIGKSTSDDSIRLYFDAELRGYISIPKADILYSVEKSEKESPAGGSYLWVKKDSNLKTVPDTSSKESFFKGPITEGVPPTPLCNELTNMVMMNDAGTPVVPTNLCRPAPAMNNGGYGNRPSVFCNPQVGILGEAAANTYRWCGPQTPVIRCPRPGPPPPPQTPYGPFCPFSAFCPF